MRKLMISAAEVSGDVHGSYLVRELRKADPGLAIFGMGGERMRAEGVDIRIDITSRSTIGIFEAIRHIPSHLRTIRKLKAMMDAEKPDAIILIDAQGFNMPIAKIAKSKGIRTIYYVAPQEWLWGTDRGVRRVVNTIDLIISIFDKEHDKFISAGGNSLYYGHPLIDIVKKTSERFDFSRKYGLDPSKKMIAICPGSRAQEIGSLLPMFIEIARRLLRSDPDIQFVLPLSSTVFRERINRMISASGLKVRIVEKDGYNALANSDLVIAASGTIVLESAIIGTPVIMAYKLSLPTYIVGKYLLKIKLPYYSMPNIIANKRIVPEFIMGEAKPDNIANEAIMLLGDAKKYDEMKRDFAEIKRKLGSPGVISKVAKAIVDYISN